jgi:hypothetical protein
VKLRPETFPRSVLPRTYTEMREDSRVSTEGMKRYLIRVYRIDSALLRQAVYATLRLGIYFNLTDHIKNNVNQGQNLSAW